MTDNDIVTVLRDISSDEKVEQDIRQACLDGSREIDRLRLTANERLALCYAANALWHLPWYQKTLRGLLERNGGHHD